MQTISVELETDARRGRGSQIVTGIALAAIVALAVIEVALGALPTRDTAHDLFIFLNGAWRAHWGQIPHEDFYAGFGVMLWKPLQLAFTATNFNANGIGLARAIYTVVIGVWTLLLVRRRLAPIQALIVVLVTILVLGAPHEIGIRFDYFSNSLFYNRVGYALLFVIMLDTLYLSSPWRRGAEVDRFWSGVSTGAAIICLTLLKVSFLVPALMLALAGIVLCGTSRRHLLGAAVGGSFVCIFSITFLDLRPGPWISEMVLLSQARGDSLTSSITYYLRSDAVALVAAMVTAGCVALFTVGRTKIAVKYMAATAVVLGADIYCLATNTQGPGFPLLAFWAVLAVLMVTSNGPLPRRRRLAFIGVLVLLASLSVPFLGRDALSLADAMYVSATIDTSNVPRFDAPRLESWITQLGDDDPAVQFDNGPLLVAITNDGLHLLRQYSSANETIASLSFTDRFLVALNRRPPPGGAPWIGLGNNFNPAHPPPVETLLGRPDVLMVQRFDSGDLSSSLLEAYPHLLESDYEYVASSRYWTLYRHLRS